MADDEQAAAGFAWSGEVALRWRDLDAFGHLYHGEYLVLLDEARMAMFEVVLQGARDFVVARLELDYRAQVVVDDGPLVADLLVERVGRTSVTVRETLSTRAGRVAVDSRCVVVLWDLAAGASRKVTDGERRALTGAR